VCALEEREHKHEATLEPVRDESEHRQACDPEHDFVVFKVDFKNAFNLASRARILALVTEHFPEIARWAHWCYGQPGGADPVLWFRGC
jgi:hypothetical protein